MRRRLFALFSLSLILLLGVGCKGLSEQELLSVQPVTLTYWTVFNDVDALQQLADAYHREHPYITIDVKQIRYEEFDKIFVNALADDVAPDLVSLHVRWLGRYQHRLSGMPQSVKIASLTYKGKYSKEPVVTFETHAMPSARTIQSNFAGTVAEDVVYDGYIFGLPLTLDSLAIYYNKDLLDQSGIATAPTTWEELRDAIKETTRFDANGNIVQSGISLGTSQTIPNATDIFAALMMQNGVNVMDKGTVTLAYNIRSLQSSHPTLEALRFYTDFARPTKDGYSWNDPLGDAFESFAQGRSVFYMGFAYDQSRIRARAPQMNLAVIPLPQLNEAKPVNVANYWVESVVLKSEQRDIAWDFIRFITLPDNIKTYSAATAQPSPLRAHIAEQKEDPTLGPFATQVLTAKNWYHGRDIDTANAALKNLISNYLLPYPEDVNPDKRDQNLLLDTARIIQQTL